VNSEMITQRIVLLFGSGSDAETSAALASESSQLAVLLQGATGPVEVSVISLGLSRKIAGTAEHIRLDDSRSGLADRLLTAVGAFALRRWLATFPLGRLLNSLGPVDPGRVFSRAARRHPEAMQLLHSANVAIATDVPSTKLGWLAVHRGWVDDAFFDHRSASVGVSWQLPSVNKDPRD